ncbi:hypothetical protein RMSM_00477 [Rhodopirellula maiorica SM1]|uniref:Uncharacterized protein n=1 Tax=Rhodopirellula maiorica SM1 TaxID=1265738 RepID=M5S4M7_9BACT|nr:hypothetical protein RMSM_00477 [Rhodopirellula maiorica SM1]
MTNQPRVTGPPRKTFHWANQPSGASMRGNQQPFALQISQFALETR